MQSPAATTNNLSPARSAIALFLAVFCLFSPCIRHSFIDFDDPVYLLNNLNIQRSLDWQTVKWAFTTNTANIWHPLTWLSYALDWQIFHTHAKGYYLVNVLLHAASTALLFIVLRKMTGAHWRSLFVAAVFGMHPLRVESVAWAAERKDVLSTFFWMLTMWAYVEWVQKAAGKKPGSRKFYFLALMFLAMGLLSKPMLVTLPFALLLLDYWPLSRWSRPAEMGRLLIEKIPFFALALVQCVITTRLKEEAGTTTAGLLNLGLGARIANSCIAGVAYLRKFFLPVDLAIYYPLPSPHTVSAARVAAAAALLLVLTAIAVVRMRRQPYLFTGWFWYLGTMLPVIGLVQIGIHSMADRYTYVPMIGVTLALTWGVCDAARALRLPAFVLPAAAGIALAGCALLTLRQIGFWKDSETAFRRSLAVTPEANAVAQIRLGAALLKSEKVDEAISHFQHVLDMRKNSPDAPVADAQLAEAHLDLAMALLRRDDFAGAAGHLKTSLAAIPDDYMGHYLLGVASQGMGAWNEAGAQYQEAIELKPDFEDAYMNDAGMLANLGRWDEAIAQCQALLRVNPRSFDAHDFLGAAFTREERWDDAIREFQEAINENPTVAETHNNLGVAFQNVGKLDEAIEQYREAVRLNPDYATARANLDSLLKKNDQ